MRARIVSAAFIKLPTHDNLYHKRKLYSLLITYKNGLLLYKFKGIYKYIYIYIYIYIIYIYIRIVIKYKNKTVNDE